MVWLRRKMLHYVILGEANWNSSIFIYFFTASIQDDQTLNGNVIKYNYLKILEPDYFQKLLTFVKNLFLHNL